MSSAISSIFPSRLCLGSPIALLYISVILPVVSVCPRKQHLSRISWKYERLYQGSSSTPCPIYLFEGLPPNKHEAHPEGDWRKVVLPSVLCVYQPSFSLQLYDTIFTTKYLLLSRLTKITDVLGNNLLQRHRRNIACLPTV